MSRRLRGDDGATVVEVALVLPLLLLLLSTITVFGLRMMYGGLAGHTADVAVRKATIRTSAGYPDAAAVDASVRSMTATDLLGDPSVPVTLAVDSTTARKRQGDRVTVTVQYDVPVLHVVASGIPGIGGLLEDLAVIRVVREGRLE